MTSPRILFIFVDGIGLGDDDPAVNPFAVANMPTLNALSNGKRWLRDTGRQVSERAVFIPTDPRLGVPGRPQSGTSQAAILTGLNVPRLVGEHYGPKPNEQTRAILTENNFFKQVIARGKKAALLDAYPPGLLESIARGKTLPSSIQYAVIAAGQTLFSIDDVIARRALTPEWTGHSWREHLKIMETPLYTPQEAGHLLVELSKNYDFAFHSHWYTDYVGHRGPFETAVQLLEMLDGVMQGILEKWDDRDGLVILTSDHGNMEVIGERHHTENDVPTLIIGGGKEAFAEGLTRLTDFVPRMAQFLSV
jgi:2,3-bisphosphoglycerate-independent phosphoglycerate mutase